MENTNNIKSNKAKVVLDDAELRNVFEAPERAVRFVTSADYEACWQTCGAGARR